MRDAKRIPEVIDRLQKIWEKYPDLRLGQLIGNVAEGPGLYYVDDEVLIEALERFYNNLGKEGK